MKYNYKPSAKTAAELMRLAKENEERNLANRLAAECVDRIKSPMQDDIDVCHLNSIEFCFGLALCCTRAMTEWLEEKYVTLHGLDNVRRVNSSPYGEAFRGIIKMLTPEHAHNFVLLIGCFACVGEDEAEHNAYSLELLLRVEHEEMYRLMKRKYHGSAAPYSLVYGEHLDRDEEINIEEFTSNNDILLRFFTSFLLSNTFDITYNPPEDEIEKSFGVCSVGVLRYIKIMREGFSSDRGYREYMESLAFGDEPIRFDYNGLCTFFESQLVTDFFLALRIGETEDSLIYADPYDFCELFSGFEHKETVPIRELVARIENFYSIRYRMLSESDDDIPDLPVSDLMTVRLNGFGYLYGYFNSSSGDVTVKDVMELMLDIIYQEFSNRSVYFDKYGTPGAVAMEVYNIDAVMFIDMFETGLLQYGLYKQYVSSNRFATETYEYDSLAKEEAERQKLIALQNEVEKLRSERDSAISSLESEKRSIYESAQAKTLADTKNLRSEMKKLNAELESQKKKLEKANAEIQRLNERLQVEKDQSAELLDLLNADASDGNVSSDVSMEEKMAFISKFRLCLCGGHTDNIARLKRDAKVVSEYGDTGVSNNAGIDVLIYFTDWLSHRLFYSAQSWCRKSKTPYVYVSGAKNYDLIVDIIYSRLKIMEEKGVVSCVD